MDEKSDDGGIKEKIYGKLIDQYKELIPWFKKEGINLIPLEYGDKIPAKDFIIKWEQYQLRKSTKKEWDKWQVTGKPHRP